MQVQEHYLESVHRVLTYVDDNLDSDLSAGRLAEVALFSKYHFHRIFKALTGETVSAFVVRRRLERAVFLFKSQPGLSVTDVALRVGFNSPEHFSRCFKERFNVTATRFRQSDNTNPESLKNSRIYQEVSPHSFYHTYLESRNSDAASFEVQLKQFEETPVALVSEKFGKDGTALVEAWNHLMEWADARSLRTEDCKRYAISRDDFEVTAAEDYRLDFCISIPPDVVTGGRIHSSRICGGTYALIHVTGDIHQVAKAWDFLYKDWLPLSNFTPVNEPAVEIFLEGPETIGWEQFDLEIGIPVVESR